MNDSSMLEHVGTLQLYIYITLFEQNVLNCLCFLSGVYDRVQYSLYTKAPKIGEHIFT